MIEPEPVAASASVFASWPIWALIAALALIVGAALLRFRSGGGQGSSFNRLSGFGLGLALVLAGVGAGGWMTSGPEPVPTGAPAGPARCEAYNSMLTTMMAIDRQIWSEIRGSDAIGPLPVEILAAPPRKIEGAVKTYETRLVEFPGWSGYANAYLDEARGEARVALTAAKEVSEEEAETLLDQFETCLRRIDWAQLTGDGPLLSAGYRSAGFEGGQIWPDARYRQRLYANASRLGGLSDRVAVTLYYEGGGWQAVSNRASPGLY